MQSSIKAAFLALTVSLSSITSANGTLCDTVQDGYQCDTAISHIWGQYSPYFDVQGQISSDVPSDCEVTFAQVLARHGARYPTSSKSKDYGDLIKSLQKNVSTFTGQYSFLANYTYDLGADSLTAFGQQEMVNSGIQFAHRYQKLAEKNVPFVRASSAPRVVESAQNWTQGFGAPDIEILILSEASGSNNSLNHGLCTQFEKGSISKIGDDEKAEFAATFVPSIQDRLNKDLVGAKLKIKDVIALMDLCPFDTVASQNGSDISPFCGLFTEAEWQAYNYYETLDKFYGYGNGNPLGPTQGIGFTNELLARMTNSSVSDHTSTNHTLDKNPKTFPLGRKLYADFTHDNDLTSIFSALGLYNKTVLLSNETIIAANSSAADGYSAAWTVPFSARAYFEKLQCGQSTEELVRVIVNGRVVPLVGCGANAAGMCNLSAFVQSQGFARDGGLWNQCFS